MCRDGGLGKRLWEAGSEVYEYAGQEQRQSEISGSFLVSSLFTSYVASWVRIFSLGDCFPGVGTGNRKAASAYSRPGTTFAYGDFASASAASVINFSNCPMLLLMVGLLFHSGEPCLFNPHTLLAKPMARSTAELQCLLTAWALTPIKTYPRHGLTGLKPCMGFCQA